MNQDLIITMGPNLTIGTDQDLIIAMGRDLITEMDQDLLTIMMGRGQITGMDHDPILATFEGDLIIETFEGDLILNQTFVRGIGWKVLDLQGETLRLITVGERIVELRLHFGGRDRDHKALLLIETILLHGTTMTVLGIMEKMPSVDVRHRDVWSRAMTREVLFAMILEV